MENVNVVVIGGNHHNTLGVVRALGRKGIKPFLILIGNRKKSYVSRSKYIKGWISLSMDEIVPYLLDYNSSNQDKTVIISCHDGVTELLERNRMVLRDKFIVPGTDNKTLLPLFEKPIMTADAANLGFDIPLSYDSKTIQSISNLKFPLISKPSKSVKGSKKDINVFHNATELNKFLNLNKERDFQIQQYIDFDIEYQLIGASFNGGKEIIIPGVSVILRPFGVTNTQFLLYKDLSEDFLKTAEMVKDYIRNKQYSGLFSAEFLRGKDGKDYFMEINFRNDGNTIAVTNSGANLPYWWVMKNLGRDVETPKFKELVYMLPEHRELSLWRKRIINTKALREDIRKTTCYAKYASDDAFPTFGKMFFYAEMIWAGLARIVNGVRKV